MQGKFEDEHGAFILNVVVGSRFRRAGCGKVIMASAEEVARQYWGAKRVYAHVSPDNVVRLISQPILHTKSQKQSKGRDCPLAAHYYIT